MPGFVVNADGNDGGAGVARLADELELCPTELQATALADGSFRFDGVPAGAFTLDASEYRSADSAARRTGAVAFEGQVVDATYAWIRSGSCT